MKSKYLLIVAIGLLTINSCKNKGTKPLLPYFLGEEITEVWILPEQEKSAFVKFPNFDLKDQFDVEIKSKHLQNKAFVVNFFYGGCKNSCAKTLEAMDSLQNRLLKDEVLFLSISIESQRDSLGTLKFLAEKHHANPEKWRLLSGDKEQVDHILKSILNREVSHPNDFNSYNELYLFDNQGYLRGIYDINTQVAIENLILDTRLFR